MKKSYLISVLLVFVLAGCGNGSNTNGSAQTKLISPAELVIPGGAGADSNGFCTQAFISSANQLKDVANNITEITKDGAGVKDPRFMPSLKRFNDACDALLTPYGDTICNYENETVRASDVKPSCDQVKEYYNRLNGVAAAN